MKISSQFQKNSGVFQVNQTQTKAVQQVTSQTASGKSLNTAASQIRSLKRSLYNSDLTNERATAARTGVSKILGDTRNYAASLASKRTSDKNTALTKKRLKYSFKEVSSKIIRSKKSTSAHQAASQAKREVMRLKKERATGNYDADEIEAALAHAKAMERIARKKEKHLLEEEMAKAAGGPCADYLVEEEKEREAENTNPDEDISEEELLAEGDVYEDELEDFAEEYMFGEGISLEDFAEEYMSAMDGLEDFALEMGDMMSDLMSEFEEGMQELLEEFGLDEMADSAAAVKGDMDPEDLKMMIIKHRNKEMKEIVKADSEYLKAYFKFLEKSTGATPGGSVESSANQSAAVLSAGGSVSQAADLSSLFASASVPDAGEAAAPTIDISL